MSLDPWGNTFWSLNALYIHDGVSKRPHVALSDTVHASGYFNSFILAERPRLLSKPIDELLVKMRLGRPGSLQSFDAVIGSADGSIPVAFEVARQTDCRFGYTEKQGDGRVLRRFDVRRNRLVLVVEDVITTGQEAVKTIMAIEALGGQVYPMIGTLLSLLSGETLATPVGELPVVALSRTGFDTWSVAECPLCRLGSRAIARPRANWKDLTTSLK